MDGPILALHGLPTHPALWSRLVLPLDAPPLRGLVRDATEMTHPTHLGMWLDDLRAHVTPDTILLGHDLGGVLAALLAAERPVRALVLSGTSLDLWYWSLVRASALPLAHRWFYERHGGRRFLCGGMDPAHRAEARHAFLSDLPPDYPQRMRSVARAMRLPRGLVRRLRDTCVDVSLVWGRRDPWYPLPAATRLARRLGARMEVVEAGHLAPWEAPDAFTRALERCVGVSATRTGR